LIGLSAQCGVDSEDKIDVSEEEAITGETSIDSGDKDTSGSEDGADETDSEGEEDSEGEAGEADSDEGADEVDSESDDTYIEEEAPTIALEVYEGPIYSATDDVCYWKVQANATGTPYPRVDFNRDDSHGSWGSSRVQVNLYSPSETFTLIATATNSEGSATDSITLDWGCGVPEPEPDTPEEDTTDSRRPSEDIISIGPMYDLSGIVYESGSFLYSNHTLLGLKIIVGDAANNDQIKAYISFNISALHGRNVQNAEISFVQTKREDSHPESFAKTVDFKAFNYGNSLDSGDFAVGGTLLERIPILTTSYTVSGDSLISELQNVLDDSGRGYFQVKLGLNAKTNNNGLQDDIVIDLRNVSLHIRYSD